MKNKKSIGLDILARRLVKPIHQSVVSGRRIKVLSDRLSKLIPNEISLSGLDVGCGSGELARNIKYLHPQIEIVGVDVLVRGNTAIKVSEFDGKQLPFADRSFDFVMLVDVLHHTSEPLVLLKECARVSRQFILLKDHICESWWDRLRLSFMDWVGNRAYNVTLPYNYQSQDNWNHLFEASRLSCDIKYEKLGIYPQPVSLLFDSALHFVAKLSSHE